MLHANSVTVRVETPLTVPLGRTMNEMRTWLDGRKIQPLDFRPVPTPKGFAFEIRFLSEDDASLFKQDFA